MRVYKADGTKVNLQEIENSGVIHLNDIITYEIINGICYVDIYNGGLVTIKANEYITIGKLPVLLNAQYNFCVHFIGGKYIAQSCHVTTNGEIKIFLNESFNYFAGSFCFPILIASNRKT